MLPTTIAFANDYIEQLRPIRRASQAYDELADWLLDNVYRIQAVVDDLNNSLALQDHKRFRFHIPTFAVGDLSGLVVVSANPGFNATANEREHAFRMAGHQQNQSFGRNFFTTFLDEVGKNCWWTRVLGFSHRLQMRTPDDALPLTSALRWAWASERPELPSSGYAGVANVDLIPFHSTADGFGCMRGEAAAHSLLRSIAIETLKTVIRLEPSPRLVLVASKGGSELLRLHYEELGLQRMELGNDTPFKSHLNLYRHLENGSSLVTFNRQLFAGNFAMSRPVDFSWHALAGLLRPLASPPY